MAALKGTEVSLSYIQCFLYLVSSSINVSIFHSTWLDTFWTDLWIHIYITHRHRQQWGVSQREKEGGGRWRRARLGKMGMERDSVWDDGHTRKYAEDVLLSFTLETCMVS